MATCTCTCTCAMVCLKVTTHHGTSLGSVLTRILHLVVQGPIKTKKVGHLRDRLGRYEIRMYIDGRQLNDVIFDHSLIVTEINFTNTSHYIHCNCCRMSIFE